jgi:hypothetical protein
MLCFSCFHRHSLQLAVGAPSFGDYRIKASAAELLSLAMSEKLVVVIELPGLQHHGMYRQKWRHNCSQGP